MCYYIYGQDITKGSFVDVAEPNKITKFFKDFGIVNEPVHHIMTTHHHYDHAQGNNPCKRAYPNCRIMGGKEDNVDGCTDFMKHGNTFDLFDGTVKATCLHTPCHTRGHMCYYLEGSSQKHQHTVEKFNEYQIIKNLDRCVFTGDTVFVGGCGLFMEGNAEQMVKAMDTIMALPEDTKVFVGHEYT